MSTENSVREDVVLALGSDYDIVRELGRGGASVVYLGRDRVLGREVAIKVIRDAQSTDAEAVARFEREARTLAALQHPNIVMLYGARPLPGGSLALIMQHGEWSTLKSLIREQGPMPIEAVQQVLSDLASALVYLHRHHVIHRDIKPENIFIESETGRALLSDFGIAKSGDARTSVTLTGVVIGTPAYMSPEQIDGGELTGRSDLYSLGMVGYEMLTGVRPWDGESLFGVIYKQKTEKLPAVAQKRPDTPEHLGRLIERSTEKLPAERWASAQEFLGALTAPAPLPLTRSWAEAIPAAPSSVEALPAADYPTLEIEQALVDQAFAAGERVQRRRQRLMAAAVVVLLFSGGAGALAFSGREPGQGSDSGFEAPFTPPSAYTAETDYSATPDPAAVDTPSFVLEEPVVGSAPRQSTSSTPQSETPRQLSAQASAEPREVASTTRDGEQTQAREARVDSSMSIAPPTVLPALSVTRPRRNTQLSASSAVDTSRQTTETAVVAAPVMRNRERIGQLLADRYPNDLRTRGVGGTTVLTVLVAPDGTVDRSSMVSSSGQDRLDAAALAVAPRMIFAHPQGAPRQAVWVSVPLTFNPN
jgi:TonB family protein